jgi:DNA-binding SARP family transcriptional activator
VLDFRILGPLEVVDHEQLSLGGRKQQAVLAALLLHRGEVVTADRLIESVWGGKAPATAGKTLQVYVSNLRKALGDGLLVTYGRGYRLVLDPGQVDSDRFAALAAKGRQALDRGELRQARTLLEGALSMWRGPALADFSYESFAQPEIARLEEARLGAVEDRIEADLRLGQHATAVPELEALVHEHPLRERLYEQLMVALYRSGRQVDALDRYQRARRKLIDEFGIEPGPRLQEIQRAVLAHDASLELAPRARAPKRRRGPRPSLPNFQGLAAGAAMRLGPSLKRLVPRRNRDRGLVTAACAAVVLAVVLPLVLSSGGSHHKPVGSPQPIPVATAQILSPASGGVYARGQLVPTKFSCVERSKRIAIASCRDSNAANTVTGGNGHLDTTTVGTHRYTVVMTTKNGVTRRAGITYTVVALMVSIETSRATISRGRTSITIACSGAGMHSTCRGRLSLTLHRREIATSTYAIPAGAKRTIRLYVRRFGALEVRRARGRHLPALATATLAYSKTVQQPITLSHRRG